MIKTLWKRHFFAGTTGSFHGDMATAFMWMLLDSECDQITRDNVKIAIGVHLMCEMSPQYTGRRWFCEIFGDDFSGVDAVVRAAKYKSRHTDDGVYEQTAGIEPNAADQIRAICGGYKDLERAAGLSE